jgi:hypothetical protein
MAEVKENAIGIVPVRSAGEVGIIIGLKAELIYLRLRETIIYSYKTYQQAKELFHLVEGYWLSGEGKNKKSPAD